MVGVTMKNQEKLEKFIEILKTQNITLGVAESLTGGLLSATIVNVSGASQIYKGAIIAYSPEIKTKLLGVNPQLIEEQGTVCSQVAEQMAKGTTIALDADFTISTTGVAGPGPHEGKPAGTVYVGISFKNKETTFLFKTNGDRQEIRCNTVEFCIDKALELLSSLEK